MALLAELYEALFTVRKVEVELRRVVESKAESRRSITGVSMPGTADWGRSRVPLRTPADGGLGPPCKISCARFVSYGRLVYPQQRSDLLLHGQNALGGGGNRSPDPTRSS